MVTQALQYLNTVKAMGSKTSEAIYKRSTRYRHKQNLKLAGLTDADLQCDQLIHGKTLNLIRLRGGHNETI